MQLRLAPSAGCLARKHNGRYDWSWQRGHGMKKGGKKTLRGPTWRFFLGEWSKGGIEGQRGMEGCNLRVSVMILNSKFSLTSAFSFPHCCPRAAAIRHFSETVSLSPLPLSLATPSRSIYPCPIIRSLNLYNKSGSTLFILFYRLCLFLILGIIFYTVAIAPPRI